MRRWITLLTLLLIALAPPLARADVQFRGLHASPLGACVVDLDGDGLLDLSNIGSSGQDGVSLDCTHFDGAALALKGTESASSCGASQTFSYIWTLVSAPQGSPARVSTGVSLEMACDGSGWKTRGQMGTVNSNPLYRVVLKNHGTLIDDFEMPVDGFLVIEPDAAGECPNPTFQCRIDRGDVSVVRAGIRLAASTIVHRDLATRVCDEIEFSATVDAGLELDGSSCELRLATATGAPPKPYLCADGACRALSHWLQSENGSSLSLEDGPSSLRNVLLGSSSSSVKVSDFGMARLASSSGGGGGGGGGGGAVLVGDLDGDGVMMDASFLPPSVSLDPATGASSLDVDVAGDLVSSGGTSSPAHASLHVDIGSSSSGTGAGVVRVACDQSSLGSSVQWVTVLDHGVEVARASVPSGSLVEISPPPGGSPVTAIVSAGASRGYKPRGHVTLLKGPRSQPLGALSSGDPATSSTLDASCPMEVSFRSKRVVLFGGQVATGDQLVFTCDVPAGGSTDRFVAAGSTASWSDGTSSSSSSLRLLGVGGPASDVIGPVAGGASLSSSVTCASVPFDFVRTDGTPVRGFSVTFHLSPELVVCGTPVTEGDYLSSFAQTQMFATDNGGGSWTVDCSILGASCGPTTSGRLFSLQVAAAPGVSDGVGEITVDQVIVRDCTNQPVPAAAGGPAFVPVRLTAPAAPTGLTAVQQLSGNPAGGTTAILLSSSSTFPPGTGGVVYRAPFGNYPYYSSPPNAGSVPAPPASPPPAGSGWEYTPVGLSSGVVGQDVPPTRDFYYYVAFAVDAFGNVSPPSSMTTGTLDYHLGDVSDGAVVCSGDNHVDLVDVSLLGAHYGSSVSPGSSYACLDVGPTTDFSVGARPVPDGRVSFEDLMVFAINFEQVSAPRASVRPAALAANALRVAVPEVRPAAGSTFDAAIEMDGAGDVQGVSVRLAYDAARVVPVRVAGGGLLEAQGRASTVLSSGPGDVDAALLGPGDGIAGRGELARVTFQVVSEGDPGITIAGATARDGANRAVSLAGSDAGSLSAGRTGLGPVFPNPFRDGVDVRLGLQRAAAARLEVYDVAGRRVRTLLEGVQPAGARSVRWDGRDDAGLRLAPGTYVIRLVAGELRDARVVRLVR